MQLDFTKEPLLVRFQEFNQLNPDVYKLFKKFTFQMIEAGHTKIGSKMIIERIRWESKIKTEGDVYKVNNNFTAYYARLFIRDFPQYQGLFFTRELKAY